MSVVVLITQSGAGITVSASGTIDLTDLRPMGGFTVNYDWGHVVGGGGFVIGAGLWGDQYTGIHGPSTFGVGSGGAISWSNFGDVLMMESGYLGVPYGYVSGSPIYPLGSYFPYDTYLSFGVIPGSEYLYTWGTGEHADSLTVRIGDNVVPEPATWMLMLLGFIVLGRKAWQGVRQS